MKIGTQEPFEKPEGGAYVGRLIDIVEKPNVPVTYGGVTKMQDQVTFTWVLDAVDSKGRNFLVFETYNAYLSAPGAAKPSKLYTALTQILNAAPPVISDTSALEPLLLNRTSGLLVMKAPKVQNPADFTVKIIGHTPLKAGQTAPNAPQGFVRAKDRKKEQAGPNPGQSTPTYSQPPAQQAPAVDLNAPQDNEAF